MGIQGDSSPWQVLEDSGLEVFPLMNAAPKGQASGGSIIPPEILVFNDWLRISFLAEAPASFDEFG